MTLLALCKAASHFRDSTRLPGSAFYFLMSRAIGGVPYEYPPHSRFRRGAIRPVQPCGRSARGLSAALPLGRGGVLPDGTVPQGIEAQADACWRNIIAFLADAGMRIQDLVKITTYLVRPEDVAAAGAARAKHFGDARPGSATIIVKALVNPSLLIEIEAVAAARAR